MTVKRSSKKIPELRVVFDSNALYTGSASDLLSHEVTQLITGNSHHSDLSISWLLPEIVMHERQFQMIKRGLELLPSIQKLEKLLGHNLNITDSIIERGVKETVERQLQQYNIQVVPLKMDKVDWNRVMFDSVYRRPPFDPGEKEKGFRDTLVTETFLQLLADSPVTPKVCRVTLVSSDKLLGGTVSARTTDRNNVRIVTTLEELKSLINTLVAEVGEEFVASIQQQAKDYFFIPLDNDTLYYKENISDKLQEMFGDKLQDVPKGADRRQNGKWFISPPRFIKKEAQRVFWTNRISVEATAYKYTATEPFGTIRLSTPNLYNSRLPLGGVAPGNSSTGLTFTSDTLSLSNQSTTFGSPEGTYLKPYTLSSYSTERSEAKFATGKSFIEITWSVTVGTNRRFSTPKIENSEFIETSWE